MKIVKCPHCKSKEIKVITGYAMAVHFRCKQCNKYFVMAKKGN